MWFTYEKLIMLLLNLEELFQFLLDIKLIHSHHGRTCFKCGKGQLILKDNECKVGGVWNSLDPAFYRCNNRKCCTKVSLRKGTFFEKTKLSIQTVLKFVHLWIQRTPNHIIEKELNISSHTIVDWRMFCRDICCQTLEDLPLEHKVIGGPDKIVEIDESMFGKRKYNRGKKTHGVWVFGGIERGAPENCFFKIVHNRTSDTLIPIIKEHILPETTIVSDCWRSYDCIPTLPGYNFKHEKVNHSVEFTNENGQHTNTIECTWSALKRFVPRQTPHSLKDSYFCEFVIRRKVADLQGIQCDFVTFLMMISKVYSLEKFLERMEKEQANREEEEKENNPPNPTD